MKRLIAAAAAALLLTSHGGAAAAPLASIDGRVSYNYDRSYLSYLYPSAQDVSLRDTVEYSENLTLNTLTTFAVASQAADRVGAAVVVRVGDGWMRFNGTVLNDISATPYGVNASGFASYMAQILVQDSITVDAPGRTGQAGSATLGFLVDGARGTFAGSARKKRF